MEGGGTGQKTEERIRKGSIQERGGKEEGREGGGENEAEMCLNS